MKRTLILPMILGTAILIYIGFILAPLVYANREMTNTVSATPALTAQLGELEAELRNLRENEEGHWPNNQMWKIIVSYDCRQGAYAEMFDLIRLYDLTVETMKEESRKVVTEDQAAVLAEVPVFFRLSGKWHTYMRFKRALSIYPCPTQITKERIVAARKTNSIVADISLSMFKPSDNDSMQIEADD